LQGLALIIAMALITLFVVVSVRDMVLVMIDIAMMFEALAARLDPLIRPLMERHNSRCMRRQRGSVFQRTVLRRCHDHDTRFCRYRADIDAGAGTHRRAGGIRHPDAAVRFMRSCAAPVPTAKHDRGIVNSQRPPHDPV
jgi:hypothetical protein